jgi:hypothetical protein
MVPGVWASETSSVSPKSERSVSRIDMSIILTCRCHPISVISYACSVHPTLLRYTPLLPLQQNYDTTDRDLANGEKKDHVLCFVICSRAVLRDLLVCSVSVFTMFLSMLIILQDHPLFLGLRLLVDRASEGQSFDIVGYRPVHWVSIYTKLKSSEFYSFDSFMHR